MYRVFLSAILLLLTSAAAKAAIVTYTVEGTATFDQSSANLLPDFENLVRGRVADGASFTLTFDLELNGADANPDPNVADFNGVVSAQSLALGGLAFGDTAATCAQDFLCRVRATNFLFTPTTGVTNYALNSGLMISPDLDADLRALHPTPITNQQTVGAEIDLGHTFSDLLDIGSLVDIEDLDFNVTTRMILLLGSIATTDNDFAVLEYDLDVTDIYQGSPVASPVPLPAAFWLFATGLTGLLLCRKRPLQP